MDWNDTVYYPQDEMTTFLLPVTVGCRYNQCAFCSMYRDVHYGEVPGSEIELQLRNGNLYTEKVFLTGADPMSIGFDKMKRLLELIRRYFPYCARVAAYASVRSIANYSVEELSVLHDAGLRLLYIGFETGRDDILNLMHKGHTVHGAIQQAKKLNEAKLAFHSIVMYGIAGKGGSVDNAAATAEMLNQFETNKVITMNLTVLNGTELDTMVKNGRFVPTDRRERLLELKTLLERLAPSRSTEFDTTHPTNIIFIKGVLPQDRERLIGEVAKRIPA